MESEGSQPRQGGVRGWPPKSIDKLKIFNIFEGSRNDAVYVEMMRFGGISSASAGRPELLSPSGGLCGIINSLAVFRIPEILDL